MIYMMFVQTIYGVRTKDYNLHFLKESFKHLIKTSKFKASSRVLDIYRFIMYLQFF